MTSSHNNNNSQPAGQIERFSLLKEIQIYCLPPVCFGSSQLEFASV